MAEQRDCVVDCFFLKIQKKKANPLSICKSSVEPVTGYASVDLHTGERVQMVNLDN